MEQSPKHFYRYRKIAGESGEFLRKTLLEDELYFPKPSSFNDPFDCLPSFQFDASDAEVIKYYARILKKRNPLMSEEQVLSESLVMLYDPKSSPRNPDYLSRVQEMHTDTITERIGVLCISEVSTDILMWSHYADFHRGVCLQFDGLSPFFATAHRVNYLADRPRINPFLDSTEQMMEAALLAKAQHWSYEKEWRVIQYLGGPDKYKFPPEALIGVVLGSRISSADEETVRTWIKGRETRTNILRASVSRTAYALQIA